MIFASLQCLFRVFSEAWLVFRNFLAQVAARYRSVMHFRDGSERRVYGKIARVAFAMRAAARAKRQINDVAADICEPAHTQLSALDLSNNVSNDNKPSCAESPLPRPPISLLVVPPSVILRAEMKDAPALYEELTEGGVSITWSVERYHWNKSDMKRMAQTYAKALELLPEHLARHSQVWATLVCHLTACFAADLCPPFYQAQLRAAELNLGYFSYVPQKGKYGWRKRAKWAALLDK